MTVTVDQLRNLTDRASAGLSADEQQRLRDGINRLAEYENTITWMTTCTSCARILDSSVHETERAVRAETALAEARQLHAKTCPLAQGAVSTGFTCSLCDTLTAPARETT